jgi:hypothetical protein
MRCHRCQEPMTLYVVGRDYCKQCVVEMSVRAEQDARRAQAKARFRVVKELTPLYPGEPGDEDEPRQQSDEQERSRHEGAHGGDHQLAAAHAEVTGETAHAADPLMALFLFALAVLVASLTALGYVVVVL